MYTEERIAELLAENATLRAQIAELTAAVAKLTDRVTELLVIAQQKTRPPPKPGQP